MTLRVVVIGAGRAGSVHARNFAAGVAGATLVGVADVDGEARKARAEEVAVLAYPDVEAVMADDEVDAVVIGTPTFTHAEIATAALSAGKHVLSEKPLASSLEEAHRIASAVEKSGKTFMIGFMRRFDRGFRRASERIAAGDIGEPLLVRSTTRGPGLPPPWAWNPSGSGGLVAEVNSHDLDTVRWLSRSDIDRVHAVGRAAKRPDLADQHPGFIDLLAVTAELSSGALGQIDGACPATYGYDARVEVYGSEGVVFAGSPVEGPLLVRAGEAHRDPVRAWAELFADAYRAEDVHFTLACRGEAESIPGVAEGLAALEGAFAVNRSVAENRAVGLEELR